MRVRRGFFAAYPLAGMALLDGSHVVPFELCRLLERPGVKVADCALCEHDTFSLQNVSDYFSVMEDFETYG